MADAIAAQAPATELVEGEDEGDWDGEYEEEDEEDIDAAAEEIARRLQAELWADINKVAAEAPKPEPPQVPPNPKEHAAVLTVRAILTSLEHDSLAKSTLAASKMTEFRGDSLLDIFKNIATSGKIPRGASLPISRFLVSLARSEILFGSLRHSDASSLQLKRKREEADSNEPASKRAHTVSHPLYVEVAEAVRAISHTLTTSQTFDSRLITSIQPHLHRVFLFAVSSSGVSGPNTNALQEISGLIQVLGVLSGIQIGQAPNAESQNILTAVHPCLVDGCGKYFGRLYSLRAHDQKRHKQTSWKCGGCHNAFPSRDAVEQHKATTKASQPSSQCGNAQIIELAAPGSVAEAEDGEIEAVIITGIQAAVMELHAPLQAHVSRVLGAPSGQPVSSSADPTNGQATLASVIARAQATQARRGVNEAPQAANAAAAPNPSARAAAPPPAADTSAASLSMYGLSDEQTKLLEEAIANAATAAQAEAEAQAALEEQDDYDEDAEGGESSSPPDASSKPPPPA
ncbi:hypothetical protein B0H11DRAFT_2274593 [Mycena galericulata]|nr:hypothetical protein B0H11DRAFT_2274593 [Mycena galericulata]